MTVWTERWQHALMDNYGTPPVQLVRGKGARVWDVDGKEYIDLLAGIAVNALLGVLDVSKQALHAPLRELVDKGLIAATPAAHDRRVKQLTLTDAGAALEAELSGTQLAMLEKVFADAGLEAEAAWRGLMEQISRSR